MIDLKEKIEYENLIFNLQMEIWQLKHKFEYENILTEIKDNLLAVNNYYTKSLRELIILFGYAKVEKYFIDKKGESK